jgi:hypothetical protein
MRHTISRVLQFLGLLILPLAIVSELDGQVGLGRSMLMAAGGVLIFYIGLSLQGRGPG